MHKRKKESNARKTKTQRTNGEVRNKYEYTSNTKENKPTHKTCMWGKLILCTRIVKGYLTSISTDIRNSRKSILKLELSRF